VPEKKWETYEEVAAYLLNQFAEHFGVGRFEGKQLVAGESGTEWQIDAKGCAADEGHFLVVECKRHTKAGISQAITAALAWSIQDTGAGGGILVSPIGLQKGAKKVAAKSDIVEVVLDQNSTTTDYMLKFLNQVCIGFSDTVDLNITESLTITLIDKNGNVIETRTV
jgi:hypothetical protein